jgi:hypothetical protein
MNIEESESILGYLADLAPARNRLTDIVTRKSEFAWLGSRPSLMSGYEDTSNQMVPRSSELRRLAGIDALHPTERLLRLGWLFVTGTIDVDGKPVRHCLPLLSAPIKLTNLGVTFQLAHTGEVEMYEGLFDWKTRAEMEDSKDPFAGEAGDGRPGVGATAMSEWVRAALARAGLPAATLVGAEVSPTDLRDEPGLKVVAGAAVYASRDVATPDTAGVLRTWAHQPLDGSAFSVLYGTRDDIASGVDDDPEIRTPLPLNRAQREAIERLRNEPITVVSGPPGTGKSHLVAAAAIDQVARGRSVLIATQSDYAASVIADLLKRHPGPRYVRFGSRDDREDVAAELGDGLARPLSGDEHDALDNAAIGARRRMDRLGANITTLLQREIDFGSGLQQREVNLLVTAQVPGVLDEDFDIAAAEKLLHRARVGAPILGSWFRARAYSRLRKLVRCDGVTTLDEIEVGLDSARAEQAVRRGLAGGGLSLTAAWRDLEASESEYRDAIGSAVEAERRARRNSRRRSTRAVATLASALRAGRARRRQLLSELDAGDFLDVLPLWIGTLQEIDDTLPVIPGAFDLVIFDEASQIDQMRAAPALARSKRAMIVGDPRQLRHVSFVSDDSMAEASTRHGLDSELARLLDVRRNSLFDTGAAATSITWLDEHFRSVPHIIGFSDRHFYSGNLRLMTQHPRNESRDAIETIRTPGTRNGDGVNEAEIEEALRQIERYAAAGVTSIGVISPFRAQADALEEAILARYDPDDLERLGLRAGTVHAFQGSERDVIIASLAIGSDAPGGSLNFLQNPNLFNVLVTRAKREMVLVTSVGDTELPPGLLADYLRYAERAPHVTRAVAPGDGWTGEVHTELARFGVTVVPSYPVAGWSVDLAVGDGKDAVGVETTVHPGGPAAHIEQHLALRRAGWEMTDVFQSRWLTDAGGAAEMLSQQTLRQSPTV